MANPTPDTPPLSTLLSHALVALTIESDNHAELAQQARTTRPRTGAPAAARGPWLISAVMYFNCLRYLSEQGITFGDLARAARTFTNLDGMRRWGYIFLARDLADPLALIDSKAAKRTSAIFPTAAGLAAKTVWQATLPAVEDRWRQRFGSPTVDELRSSLIAIGEQLPSTLPDCLPILTYGLGNARMLSDPAPSGSAPPADLASLPLISLLSKPLLAFALAFEAESKISLAIHSSVLRFAGEQPVRIRDFSALAGVSKEAIAMATGFLVRSGFATEKSDPGTRGKSLALTPRGIAARTAAQFLLADIEHRWRRQFGAQIIDSLRAALAPFTASAPSPLLAGLTPQPGNWRYGKPAPAVLPDFPMVLHRGGYPDGS